MFKKVLIYLFSFIPLFFISGPFLSGLGTVIISFYGLYSLKYFSNIKFHKSLKFFILLSLLFYSYTLISSYFSAVPEESFKASLFYFRFILFLLGAYFLINENLKFSLSLIYKILFFCFALVFLSILLEYIYNNFRNFEIESQYTGVFFDEQIAGSYFARLYPLFISLTIYFKEDFIKLSFINFKKLVLAIFFFSFLIIFLSGERSSIAIFIISNIFLIFGIKSYREAIINRYLLISVISFLLMSYFVANNTFDRVFFKTYNQIFDDQKINLLSNHHEAHFITALRMYEDNKLLGIGPRGFRQFCDNDKYKFVYDTQIQYSNEKTPIIIEGRVFEKEYDGCSTHPHNLFIQILSETGVIGIFFYLTFLFWIYFDLIRSAFLSKNKIDIIAFCALASICSSFFPILPSHNFFASYINILNFFIFSFYFLKK